MNKLIEKAIGCPYCGETINVLIDSAEVNQQYIEDCQVCCKPINFLVAESIEGQLIINIYSDDDVF